MQHHPNCEEAKPFYQSSNMMNSHQHPRAVTCYIVYVLGISSGAANWQMVIVMSTDFIHSFWDPDHIVCAHVSAPVWRHHRAAFADRLHASGSRDHARHIRLCASYWWVLVPCLCEGMQHFHPSDKEQNDFWKFGFCSIEKWIWITSIILVVENYLNLIDKLMARPKTKVTKVDCCHFQT